MEPLMEETIISERLFKDTTLVTPTSTITAEELRAINFLTTEDAVAFEPSLVIRRRFVGDPNGTMGIRGSGMFQTARSMVFADGLPLHYLLQTRWSGAPRWSLVAPGEIESAQVLYGPYSAEYSGNAMGGVVNLSTRIPEERRAVIQGSMMSQDYDVLDTDETLNGHKLYASYEDRIGDFGILTSYNHLKNKSQPMSNYRLSADDQEELDEAGVTGYIKGKDDRGSDVLYIGDSGAETAISDLYKLKMDYSLGSLQLRGTVAYEDRERDEDDKNNYLKDASGNTYWGAGARNFDERSQQRESLLLGLGLSGELPEDWFFDVYATDFDILKDEETRSGLNPQDPDFGGKSGRLTEYDDTGWQTFDIKAGTERFLDNDDMRLSVGYYSDRYKLEVDQFNTDALSDGITSDRSASGGKTGTQALFTQWGWTFNPRWDLSLGLRYEDWETKDGYNIDYRSDTSTFVEDRSEDGLSPKFSLAYIPTDTFMVRYSVAKAYRFPIVEELYSNESATTSIIISNPSLQPEEGVFHNLSLEKMIDGGSVRLNLFYDKVDDTIYNQSGTIVDNGTNVNVSTFLAVDEVETAGVEFVFNQQQALDTKFHVRFNATYAHAEITKNSVNPDIEGNDMPRVPDWRANLIVAYPFTDSFDVNASLRYASNAYGDLDSGDTESEVYGAIDSYLFVNAKANWLVNDSASVSLGVDNLFDELAYVAHPWPSRTVYLEGRLQF
jgi:iron complex outermembrane receptor protein